MKKDFKLDVIVYSDSGAIGFYWPLPLKEKYRPLVAFLEKEQPSNKMLMEFNSKNSCWIIEDKKFIYDIMKLDIEASFAPDAYLKEIADLYATIKYNREEKLKANLEFRKLPEFLSSEFLFQLMYCYMGVYTDEQLEYENGSQIYNLASEMTGRNYAPGIFMLALCYLHGLGTKRSKEKFLKYLDRACALGFYMAKRTKNDIKKYLNTF